MNLDKSIGVDKTYGITFRYNATGCSYSRKRAIACGRFISAETRACLRVMPTCIATRPHSSPSTSPFSYLTSKASCDGALALVLHQVLSITRDAATLRCSGGHRWLHAASRALQHGFLTYTTMQLQYISACILLLHRKGSGIRTPPNAPQLDPGSVVLMRTTGSRADPGVPDALRLRSLNISTYSFPLLFSGKPSCPPETRGLRFSLLAGVSSSASFLSAPLRSVRVVRSLPAVRRDRVERVVFSTPALRAAAATGWLVARVAAEISRSRPQPPMVGVRSDLRFAPVDTYFVPNV